jgi:DNA-directed RNA polymerase subunit E"
MSTKKRLKSLRACKKCRAILTPKDEVCPICGSLEFTEEWNGMVIIIREDSEVAEIFGEKRPWRYAVNLK